MTPTEALDLKFICGDLDDDEVTIREYFKALLTELWEQGEGFSGKRPLGNSGWQYDLQKPLALAGIIDATVSVYNEETRMYDDISLASYQAMSDDERSTLEIDIEIDDNDAYDKFVFEMIEAL